MRVLVSADMEGATGVTCPEDCRPGSPQWDRLRHLFTGDVAAVAEGYLEAGAGEVLVNEAHSTMRNLLVERLDPRVRLLTGNHKALGMLEGIQDRPDVVAFVGYHSGPGTEGVLSHTWLGYEVFSASLNGQPMSEGYLNALLAAEYGSPVALVSGDDVTCAEAKEYAPAAELVEVKRAVDRYTAICVPPAATTAMLRAAAVRSVASPAVSPLPDPPYRCDVEFVGTSSAGMAAWIPTVERVGPRRVSFQAGTIRELYQCFMAVARIGRSATEPRFG